MENVESHYLYDLESKEEFLWWQKKGYSYTSTGYGRKIPTSKMCKLPGDTRWRRIYCCCFSNIGTCYVVKNGEWVIIR